MLKYYNYDIVFQEIPDEVTLAINISSCPCRCPGCHSPYLWGDVGEPLTTDVLDQLIGKYDSSISCIAFMGGDAEPSYVNELAKYIHQKHPAYKVGWYSGRIRITPAIDKQDFDYIKIGPYIEHLGSLKERTTNQKLFKKGVDGTFENITSRFWK